MRAYDELTRKNKEKIHIDNCIHIKIFNAHGNRIYRFVSFTLYD
ncbi:MAG: carbon storage regulator [Clostridia bacterium]|nr:carbon storage regulator [Clostridia bacterium]